MSATNYFQIKDDSKNKPIQNEKLYALLILPEVMKGKNIDQYKAARRAFGLSKTYGIDTGMDLRKVPSSEEFYSENLSEWFNILKIFSLVSQNSKVVELSKRGEDIVLDLVNKAYLENTPETLSLMRKIGIKWKDYFDFLRLHQLKS